MKPVLITCYVNPDLDGVAAAIGYREFLAKTGRDAVVGVMGEPHDEVKYVLNRFAIPAPCQIKNSSTFDQVILADASDLIGLEGNIEASKVIEIIDHRKINDAHLFPNAKVQIEMVGAAATLIAEKFMATNLAISKESAILIYAAIISNTFNFKAALTTDRDRLAAAWLNQTAHLPENFWKELFLAKSDLSGAKLAERIEGDFAWFVMGNKKLGIAQIEIIGAEKLARDREAEIIKVLDKLKAEMKLDYIFQSTVELDGVKNYFVCSDEKTKALLEKVLEVRFIGNVAERPNLIMRKQMVPILKEELEK